MISPSPEVPFDVTVYFKQPIGGLDSMKIEGVTSALHNDIEVVLASDEEGGNEALIVPWDVIGFMVHVERKNGED